jgi:RNA polymerase sigma-70 factor, ECF subfamily
VSEHPDPLGRPHPDPRGGEAHGGSLQHPAASRERLRRVWEDNRRWVAAILLAHKPRWADLEDLLQEVAQSLVAKAGDIRDPGAVRPWLRQVAVNAARLAGRKGKLRLTQSLDQPAGGDCGGPGGGGIVPEAATMSAPAVLGRDEEIRRITELVAQLPDGYREPLLLKAVQGLSYRQIGHILGLPDTTVETRIARGRKMLRELASGDGVKASAHREDEKE